LNSRYSPAPRVLVVGNLAKAIHLLNNNAFVLRGSHGHKSGSSLLLFKINQAHSILIPHYRTLTLRYILHHPAFQVFKPLLPASTLVNKFVHLPYMLHQFVSASLWEWVITMSFVAWAGVGGTPQLRVRSGVERIVVSSKLCGAGEKTGFAAEKWADQFWRWWVA
jgi:hypothetical protein